MKVYEARPMSSPSNLPVLGRSRTILLDPRVNLSFRLFSCNAVAFLDFADELLHASLYHVHVVVGELAPFLADVTFELRPLTFQRVFIHVFLQSQRSKPE